MRIQKNTRIKLVPALTNSDDITGLDTDEGGGAVSREVTVSLLVTVVLLHVVKVVTTDDNGALHLAGDNNTSEDTSTDGDVSGEGALLINVVSSDGLLGSLEAKTNILVPTGTGTLGDDTLVVLEDGLLLLERTLGLIMGRGREDELGELWG